MYWCILGIKTFFSKQVLVHRINKADTEQIKKVNQLEKTRIMKPDKDISCHNVFSFGNRR